MNQDSYWQTQKANEPLFPDLIWSQPQNANQAGKLLIVGGNVHGFSAAGQAYAQATTAGAGAVHVALPDILRKSIGRTLPEAVYCPSTPSGSFAKQSLSELIDYAAWSDLTLVAGDLGRNSETAMMLESFVDDYKGKLCLTKDALDYFIENPSKIVNRPDTLIVVTMAELQKISLKVASEHLVTFGMSLLQLIDSLHNITEKFGISIVTKHEGNIIAAYKGRVSTTKLAKDPVHWRVATSSYCSVWWLQNTDQIFEALTSAVCLCVEILNSSN